jgi:hypothetical protein
VTAPRLCVPLPACEGEVTRRVPAQRPPQGVPKGRIEEGFLHGHEKRGLGIFSGPRGVVAIYPAARGLDPVKPLNTVSSCYRGVQGFVDGHRCLAFVCLAAPPARGQRVSL